MQHTQNHRDIYPLGPSFAAEHTAPRKQGLNSLNSDTLEILRVPAVNT